MPEQALRTVPHLCVLVCVCVFLCFLVTLPEAPNSSVSESKHQKEISVTHSKGSMATQRTEIQKSIQNLDEKVNKVLSNLEDTF